MACGKRALSLRTLEYATPAALRWRGARVKLARVAAQRSWHVSSKTPGESKSWQHRSSRMHGIELLALAAATCRR